MAVIESSFEQWETDFEKKIFTETKNQAVFFRAWKQKVDVQKNIC